VTCDNVWPIELEAFVLLDSPVTFELLTTQVYRVPDGIVPFVEFTGVTLKANPEQTDALIGVMTGTGLTETVIVNKLPVQVPDVGVTL
jgi:hypothetical protein